jgi:hypothetical protein
MGRDALNNHLQTKAVCKRLEERERRGRPARPRRAFGSKRIERHRRPQLPSIAPEPVRVRKCPNIQTGRYRRSVSE